MNLPFYDGRGVEQVAQKILDMQKESKSTIVKPDVNGATLFTRYPHSYEKY